MDITEAIREKISKMKNPVILMSPIDYNKLVVIGDVTKEPIYKGLGVHTSVLLTEGIFIIHERTRESG